MDHEENHITKFTTEFTSKVAPKDFRIENLRHYASLFAEYELAPPYPGGSHGNLSFRIAPEEESFIITASKTALFDPLADRDFVQVDQVDFEKGIVYAQGERLPSSESMIHYALYLQNPHINAIFHGHSADILAKAEELRIPITEKEEEFGTVDLVERVLDVSGHRTMVVMKNHGFIGMGLHMEDCWETVFDYFMKATKDI